MGDMCHCFWCGTKTPPCFTCLRDAPRKVMVGRISAGSGNQVCDVFLRGQTATSITMRGLDLMHPWPSSALRAPINPTGSAQPCLGHPTLALVGPWTHGVLSLAPSPAAPDSLGRSRPFPVVSWGWMLCPAPCPSCVDAAGSGPRL